MNKRQRFILVSFLLTFGLLGTQLVGVDQRYEAIIFFSGLSVLFSAWALIADLKGIEWITTLILPALYPASVALFYFLLPENTLSRVAILLLFGVGMYALLLTENIYSVAAIRTIQLLRAAHAVGFLITIFSGIFLMGTLFSFKLPFWVNGLGTFLTLFPLLLQGCWAAILAPSIGKDIWRSATVLSWIGALLAMVVSFLPMIPLVSALLISGYLYVVLGLVQQELQGRLFVRAVQEYVTVGVMVVLAALYVTYR
jgi:hypothetical protein